MVRILVRFKLVYRKAAVDVLGHGFFKAVKFGGLG